MILTLIIAMLTVAPAEPRWTIAPDGSLIQVAVEPPPLPEIVIEEPPDEHTGKPTVEPKRIQHRTHSSHLDWCMMCLGQHLRNAHGESASKVDEVGYSRWPTYHAKLHREGAYTPPKAVECSGRSCRLLSRFRQWRQ